MTDQGEMTWSARRRRYVRASLWVVPAAGVLGAIVGYFASGEAAAVILAVFFMVALAVILFGQYLIVKKRRKGADG
ncbi:MAG TPA: hypothetical protein VE197_18630 [Mycobacterium sp.]|nr:hypothetical protein [Mycobacterium sp.]